MLTISLKQNSVKERETKIMLRQILEKYPLKKWMLSNEVLIEEGVRPHSWPVITLNTRCENEHCLLAQFLHEEIHWIEEGNKERFERVMEELKTIYPIVPVSRPEGADTEKSTYRHLIVCRFELRALTELLGEEKAKQIVLENKNYTWIRRTIIHDGEKIDAVIKKHDLSI